MRTKIALLALASTAASVKAACTDNFISTKFGIEIEDSKTTLDATTAEEYKYCSLEDQDEVCCTKETYLGFQTKATAYAKELEELAGERDQYILDRRGDVLEVRDSLNRIINAVEGVSEDKAPLALAAVMILSSFADNIEAITTNFDDLKSNFLEYQKARATCMEKLLETQVSAWCLACTEGFDDLAFVDIDTPNEETITYAATVATELTTACYNYVNYSAEQSQIISLYVIRSLFSSLASIVEKVINGDASAAEDLASAQTALGKLTLPTDDVEKPVSLPTSCTANGCSWLAETAFANGLLANETIIQGGSVLTSVPTFGEINVNNGGRRLEEATEGRKLQATWTPVASGVAIAFEDNPAGVDNDQNSAVRNGVVACAIAALAAMVI